MSRIIRRAAVAITLFAGGLAPAVAADSDPGHSATSRPSASATPTQWNLEDLYASPTAWQSAYVQTGRRIDGLSRYSGHLNDSPEALARALDAIDEVRKSVERLSVYANLTADQDLRDSETQERRNRADRLTSRFGEATGYVRPELAAMAPDKLASWADSKELADHRYMLDQIIKAAPHTLSRQTESALSALAPVNGQNDTFSLLSNADIDWPKIEIDGQQRTIDQAGYTRWRSDPDRAVRERVFAAFWSKYNQYESTFGSLLDQAVLQHVIDARLHHYDSALAAAAADQDVPTRAYHQLVDSVNAHLDTLHRYLKLRARMLGVDQLHYYDIYPPLATLDRRFTIDQGRSLVRRATRPLGTHYQQLLKKATDSPWTSVYPSPGKSSGAYMAGAAYDVHPYVLMNFNGDYESVSTYAHEWGHGVHTLLVHEHQPFATADYPIFTAEVASTTNEQLLVHTMIAHASTDQARLYYIGQALEQLRGTFFRQAQFAEFELAIHLAAQNGESLSGARLTRMYRRILDKYYGTEKGITRIDPAVDIEWAYIPHFYYDFYVYQYATSIAAAHYFASRIENGDENVRKAYLRALSKGGAESGYAILKKAGVDLATNQPYAALMAYMNDLMDRADAILDRQHGGPDNQAD